MRRAAGIAFAAVAVAGGLVVVPAGEAVADGGSVCVRVRGACYPTVQAAVNAAHHGDTVRIPAGRFAGGVVVTKSITLAGAGAGRTALVGGAHVLTVGTFDAPWQPTVHVSGLTLTGGRAHSGPESVPFAGLDGAIASGAGLLIMPGQDFGPGATVTVSDSLIRNNRVSPTESKLPSADQEEYWPRCPDGFCTFAGAFGGGVDNWGDLTLVRTTVSNNRAGGPLASDADGGGIVSWNALTLDHSTVTGNTASAVAPHGRYAEGGGLFMQSGTTLTMRHSSVSANKASLTSTNPVTNPDGSSTDMLVNSGGIHVSDEGDESTVTIRSSHIDRNVAVVHNPQGSAGVQMSGMQLGYSRLRLVNSTVNNNRQRSLVKETVDWPAGGATGWCAHGAIRGLSVTGNSTVITARHGLAVAMPAVQNFARECGNSKRFTMSNSVISDNTTTARAPHGDVYVWGAGMYVNARLTMRHVAVTGNRGLGFGTGGEVKGGGIWNGAFPFLDDMNSELTLDHVRVTGNSVGGSPALTLAGGGIYTRDPITFHSSIVRHNRPDQCSGCTMATGTASTLQHLGVQSPMQAGRAAHGVLERNTILQMLTSRPGLRP